MQRTYSFALAAEIARFLQWVAQTWRMRQEWGVALLVFAVYGLWLLAFFANGSDARDFILIGTRFAAQSTVSSAIRLDPDYHYPANGIGYDGQFFYYIAVDPANARYYLDTDQLPADYRYGRILYPMLARGLALGQASLIPYALILVNWFSLAGGTLAVGAWLRRKGFTPWLALIYGLYLGLFVGLLRDLSEPLAYALAALGVYLFEYGGKRRVIWSALAFALAVLARETTAIFPLILAASLVISAAKQRFHSSSVLKTVLPVAQFAGLAFLPYLALRLFLRLWLGPSGPPTKVQPDLVPLGGILAYWPWQEDRVAQVIIVVIPALICFAMALWAIARREWPPATWFLTANVLALVVFRPPDTFLELIGSSRVATGIVLAALYCIPTFSRLVRRPYWLVACGVLWTLLTPALLLMLTVGAIRS